MVQEKRRAKEKKEFTQPNAKSKALRRAKFTKSVIQHIHTFSRKCECVDVQSVEAVEKKENRLK